MAIDDDLDVGEQIGEVFFGAFASTQAKGVYATDARGQFVHPFAEGHPVPSQFALGPALSIGTEYPDGSCHEEPSIHAA